MSWVITYCPVDKKTQKVGVGRCQLGKIKTHLVDGLLACVCVCVCEHSILAYICKERKLSIIMHASLALF